MINILLTHSTRVQQYLNRLNMIRISKLQLIQLCIIKSNQLSNPSLEIILELPCHKRIIDTSNTIISERLSL